MKHNSLPSISLRSRPATKGERSLSYLEKACERFGVMVPARAADDIEAAVEAVFTEAALFSTQYVVELVERFCEDNGVKLLFVLSNRFSNIEAILGGSERFDQGFADWIKQRSSPVVDMSEAFKTEFLSSPADPKTFLERYYLDGGHHSPLDNAFTAWTLTAEVVRWLDPKPAPYRAGSGD